MGTPVSWSHNKSDNGIIIVRTHRDVQRRKDELDVEVRSRRK